MLRKASRSLSTCQTPECSIGTLRKISRHLWTPAWLNRELTRDLQGNKAAHGKGKKAEAAKEEFRNIVQQSRDDVKEAKAPLGKRHLQGM